MMKSLSIILFSILVLALGPSLQGLPEGTQILRGTLDSKTVGSEMQMTVSDGAVLGHDSFGISVNETVRFIQPSASARVLNQIGGSSPSALNGNLIANGSVYLVNPAGIIFGPGSVIDVGRLYSIAGTMSIEDFQNGLDRFSDLRGAVRNAGKVSANRVVLAGAAVENTGTIHCPGGIVVMSAGGSLELSDSSGSLSVNLSSAPSNASLAVGDLAGQAILQSGIIEASSLRLHAKDIIHSGDSRAVPSVQAADFESLSGEIEVSSLELTGTGNSPTVALGKAGSSSIESIQLKGKFDSVSILSRSDLQVSAGPAENDSAQIRKLDLRASKGDLTISSSFASGTTSADAELLLGAENSLVFGAPLNGFDHDSRILYARELLGSSTPSENLLTLEASSLFMDELSLPLSSLALRKLMIENPSFSLFSKTNEVSPATNENAMNQSLTPIAQTALSSLPASPPGSGAMPNSTPVTTPLSGVPAGVGSRSVQSSRTGSLTDAQLALLMQQGLLTGSHYFLKAPSLLALDQKIISDLGGSAALFGGDYSVMALGSSPSQTEGSSVDDSAADESKNEQSAVAVADRASTDAATESIAPLTPVGRGVPSIKATQILDQALAPEVENRLNQLWTSQP